MQFSVLSKTLVEMGISSWGYFTVPADWDIKEVVDGWWGGFKACQFLGNAELKSFFILYR